MSTTTQREQLERPSPESSHLTVRPETDGPREVRFMFDQPDGHRIGRSLGAGLLTELVVIGLVLIVMSLMPKRVYQAVLPDRLAEDIVWLSQPGPGGGGGGGNKMPDPPKKAELKGEQKISVPTPPKPTPEPPKEEPPVEQLNIPAQTLAAAPVVFPGALTPNRTTRCPPALVRARALVPARDRVSALALAAAPAVAPIGRAMV